MKLDSPGPPPTFTRRRLGALAAGAVLGAPATAGAAGLAETRLTVSGDGTFGREVLLLRPAGVEPEARRPLLVLLHGLGESVDIPTGIRAWTRRYGLLDAYKRLEAPPVVPTSRREDWPRSRIAQVNQRLAQVPFLGAVIVCPFTPAPGRNRGRDVLGRYADWLTTVVVPSALAAAPEAHEAAVGLDGCSLGGWLALEVFRRSPEPFAALGCIQAAISTAAADSYAGALLAAMERAGRAVPVHVLTSQGDPYRTANQQLAAALARRGAQVRARVLPGPHDQPWLREAGAPEALLFHDEVLREKLPAPSAP